MNLELASTILYFLFGGFLIYLAVTITRDNFTERLNKVTGSMLTCAGLGPIFLAMGSLLAKESGNVSGIQESLLYNLHFFWEFFFPFLMIFSWKYPLDKLRNTRYPRIIYFVFIPQILHILLLVFYENIQSFFGFFIQEPDAEGLISRLLSPISYLFNWAQIIIGLLKSYHLNIFESINLLYVLVAFYFMESGRKKVVNPRIQSQTMVVLWGFRVGLFLLAISFLGGNIFGYNFNKPIETIILITALFSFTFSLVYATIRHQFLEVRLVFRQSFVYTITSAVLVGAYILLVIQSKKWLEPVFGSQAEMVSYVFIILILLIFQPINNWIDNTIKSLFIKTKTDHRNIIERFSRQVISQFEPKHLRQIIDETLRTSLLVDKVYFVLFDDTINDYALLPENDSERRIVIDRADIMLRGINLLDNPTFFSSLTNYTEDSKLAEMLQERKIRLILPMKDADHLLGFLALTDKLSRYRFSSEDINLLGVLSNQMVSALTNARLYVESLERIRLQEEVSMAREIKLDLLPAHPPVMENTVISAHTIPSRTIGGDFYDFIPLDNNRMGILIADASGKGMPAALMIAQIQAMIRSELNNGIHMTTMLKNVNHQIVKSTYPEKYVTLFYGELKYETGEFHYSNAGHNYPILIKEDGTTDLLKVGGPVVGALPDMDYESHKVILNENDLLFLFTDGLSEAMNDEEEEYTEERIMRFLCSNRIHEPNKLIEMILDDVKSHDNSFPPRDDTTIVALKMNGKIINDRS